jgi:hypothetical protein
MKSDLLLAAGLMNLAVVTASATLPFVVRPQQYLGKLPRFVAQLFIVASGYIFLSILGIGAITVGCHDELAAGSPLARAFCAYAAVFWGVRAGLAGWYDVKEYLTKPWRRVAYLLLNCNFLALTAIFGWAAMG